MGSMEVIELRDDKKKTGIIGTGGRSTGIEGCGVD
jgi:hypothetical protein